MTDSIGKVLKEARLARGYSVSDAAHATRITENQILGLEADDYSVFSSVAYARSFLGLYSGFLEVDAKSELEAMSKPGITSFRGAPLAPKIKMEPQDTIIPIVKGLPEVRPRQVKSVLVPLIFLGMLLLLPTAFFLGMRLGQAEAQAVAALSPAESPSIAGPAAGASGLETESHDPVKHRKPSDGSLPGVPLKPPLPNPELDALILGAPANP